MQRVNSAITLIAAPLKHAMQRPTASSALQFRDQLIAAPLKP